MNKIRVHVVKYSDCKNLVMRYQDPVTGKYNRSTKYTDPQTGEVSETGTNRKFAKKLAAMWEADLNAGRDQGGNATSWQAFRLRYEDEVVPSLADRTAAKISTVLNAVESILPIVGRGKLSSLNEEAISRFQAALRDGKRSEDTIAGYLAHLAAALQWAADQKLIAAAPKIRKPKRVKKQGRGSKAKGRPITTEEFERMLAKVPQALIELKIRKREAHQKTRLNQGKKALPAIIDPASVEISPAAIESWRYYLRGLWLSGLRLEESLNLYWDRSDRLCIDLSGELPMLSIPGELEKGHKDRLLPITTDFAEFFLATPKADRRGPVFRPMLETGIARHDRAGRVVSLIGELAGVKVHTHTKTGKVKFASAHDLRRSFGDRWSDRVMPQVLMELMRHESIETTMKYYLGKNSARTARIVQEAYRKAQGSASGTVSGTVAAQTSKKADASFDATADSERTC